MGQPPCIGRYNCTLPLPIPSEKDFGFQSVGQRITDQASRNALITSVFAEDPAAQAREDTLDHTNPAHYGSNTGVAGEQFAHAPSLTPIHNISSLLYMVDLSFLLREAIDTLYAPGAARRSWLEIELAISTFNNDADSWFSHLPVEFHATELAEAQPFVLQRIGLAFRFYTTKLIILQPCLRRLTRLPRPGPVCETLATTCVQVAIQMINLLPDKVDVAWLYRVTPWWCVLHYIMQSTSVLLIAVFNQDLLNSRVTIGIGKKVEKAIRWIGEMSTKDSSSQRAWLLCRNLLSRHGSKLEFKIDLRLQEP
jgi:hypothetical protein